MIWFNFVALGISGQLNSEDSSNQSGTGNTGDLSSLMHTEHSNPNPAGEDGYLGKGNFYVIFGIFLIVLNWYYLYNTWNRNTIHFHLE